MWSETLSLNRRQGEINAYKGFILINWNQRYFKTQFLFAKLLLE